MKGRRESKRKNQVCGRLIHECTNCGFTSEFKLTAKDTFETKIDHVVRRENIEKIEKSDNNEIANQCFPLGIKIVHQGFWITDDTGKHTSTFDKNCDRNSVMLDPTCLIYIYKLALRHYLLSQQVITPQDIDPANLVPHIVVRKNKTDPFSKYDTIQGSFFKITEEMISAKTDFLIVEIDEKADLHSTLIYCKKIGKKVDLKNALKTVISTLNTHPSMIGDYAQLHYFGQDHLQYWYDSPDSFPLKIKKPHNYIPAVNPATENCFYNITAAGTILI